MKRKILIPYATYGSGHKSIANYIKKYFETNGDYECLTIDLLNYSIPVIGKLSSKTTSFIMLNLPHLWSILYFAFDNKVSAYISKGINLQMFKSKQLKKDIMNFNPDITIATHFMGSDLIGKYNKKGITNSKLVTVVTDYRAHDFWLNQIKNTDAIIVSDFEERLTLLKKGFKNNQIYTTGIPIPPSMKENLDINELKRKYKIKNNKKNVLFFVGGGDGSTYNLMYFKEILKNNYDCNILLVCGKNKRAFKKAKEYVNTYKNKNVKVFGFVTTINELYEISDFVITKPGGAQVTECLLFERPMLLVKSNGGQEVENKRFLLKNGYALSAKNRRSFNKCFKKILENDNYRERMSLNISKIEQKKSMEKLFKIVEKL